jgi:phosphopantothenoylcysteine decarboxylase/phosphopantothenate--cysteine ligase
LAKFAGVIADDFLSSTYLAANAPVMVAPAMNVSMWNHPATARNIKKLKEDGVYFVEPVSGELACKTVGTGKLEDVENIAAQALSLLEGEKGRKGEKEKKLETSNRELKTRDLRGEKILITVGGTREAIDPVRFISNHSSGKMGFAVAEAASQRGASVTAVCGATTAEPPRDVKIIKAISAEEMFQAVKRELPSQTVFIGAAAVADYSPKNIEGGKIKKTNRETLILELKRTPDILSNVSQNRHDRLLVVGFAAETENVVGYAKSKMQKKNLDMVIANDIMKPGAGFDSDTNIATILTTTEEIELPLMTKRALADKILDEILKLRKNN